MGKREKIKQIYQKLDMKVGEGYIDRIMKDKERVKDFMRLYKEEEIDSMNYILGKPANNLYFSEFELEAMSKINLFNRKVIEWCKLIWENKDNEEELNKIQEILNLGRC